MVYPLNRGTERAEYMNAFIVDESCALNKIIMYNILFICFVMIYLILIHLEIEIYYNKLKMHVI